MNPKNMVFTEKYRPKLDEFIGNEIRNKIQKYLEKREEIPNFIFESKYPGTGKTSLSKAIIKELDCDALILNSSDERTLDVVRDKIKQFAITKSFRGKKCVFLDEADGMLAATQDALRTIMENYSGNVFFILTVNNINKLIEPIRSRCIEINFSYPDKGEIIQYMEFIVKSEEILYEEKAINIMVDKFYPSIKNMVLFLQDLKTTGKSLKEENIKPNEYLFEQMYEALQEKNWPVIKEAILATDINPRELNSFFWHKAVEKSNIKMIQLCCINERDMSIGADPKIIMVTSLLEMIK